VKRFLALAGIPILVLAMVGVPLIAGTKTLLLRDVLNTHLGLRASLGPALRSGETPLIDPLRSGGQPLAGNPNALPFYPDNVLLLVGSALWQLNVHFALHWLLAFVTAFWLGRAWGLRVEGSVGVATAYALSGFFFSQLNLYNGITEAALAPALWAALLELGVERTRRRAGLAVGVVWALMLLGGDPPLGLLALVGGVIVALARCGRRYPVLRLGAALVCGSLLAAPQLVETLRVFRESYRGFWGYGEGRAGARSPATLVELLVPMIYGRPDVGAKWGNPLFGGFPPLYFSLAPGLVACCLGLAAGRPKRRESVAVAAVAALGLLFAFSGGTPVELVLQGLAATGLIRYPEKYFLLAALGLALAAGSGLERLSKGEGRRALAWAASLLLLALLGLWLGFGTGGELCRRATLALFAPALDAGTYAAERLRWAGLSMFGVATLVALIAIALGLKRRPVLVSVLLLGLHAATQWLFLAPLAATDSSQPYRQRPSLLDLIPEGAVLTHSGAPSLGESSYFDLPRERSTTPPLQLVERRAHAELLGFSGRRWGRRYEFDIAPDGMDNFVVQAVTRGMANFSDERKVRILAATGVDRLLIHRRLIPETAGGAQRVAESSGSGRAFYVYEIPQSLPDAVLVGSASFAPHVNAALERIWSRSFDPRRDAVVAGEGAARVGPPGRARVVSWQRERVELEIDSEAGGFLVLRRAYLPIWRARIDERELRPAIANLTRLAVEVPAGSHRVTLWISRRPLRIAWLVSLFGLLGLVGLLRLDAVRGPARAAPGRD